MAIECSILVMLNKSSFLFIDSFCLLLVFVRCKEEIFFGTYILTYVTTYQSK